jgi:SAM-dependent methyltransferase
MGTDEVALRAMKASGLWHGSFNGTESTLQQLSPYVGKLKSGIVRAMIGYFTKPGEWVCDPFSGAGVVPLEALLMERKAAANDVNLYAYCVTRGKLEAPATYECAISRTLAMLSYVRSHWKDYDLRSVDCWVRSFFHRRTLKEVLAAFEYCRVKRDWFVAACLCGILHHQRPGFLSYPASHMVPYLRPLLFPREKYPELYGYRPLAERICHKVERAYRRPNRERSWTREDYCVRRRDARALPFHDASVDFILTSPPYYDALDYARDNRLRLWFLGEREWERVDRRLIGERKSYERDMEQCFREMHRVLKPGRNCVLIVGEVNRDGRTEDTGAVLGEIARRATGGGFALECVIEDEIPDIRRSRRGTKTTRVEKILVFNKGS